MLEVADCAAWTWDARPYPAFPALTSVWADGPNWTLGHWLNGRIGTGELGLIVRELCLRAGLTDAQIDVSALAGAVPGFRIDAIESPRASIAQLARFFGLIAVESEGRIRFLPRGASALRVIEPDDLVAPDDPAGEAIEITRAQESELDAALKWRLMRSDEDYDAVAVEAQRRIGALARVNAEDFAIAHIPSEADRQVRRALAESRAARETAVFRLPPSALALDPGDVVALSRDGRLLPFRIGSVADGPSRAIEAVRVDAGAYGLAPGAILPATPKTPAIFGAPETIFLDLPQLSDAVPAHQSLVAARSDPWTPQALWRSAGGDDWQFLARIERPARIGTLVDDFYSGPTSRFDRGNVLTVDLRGGTLQSVTDLALFAGTNALALETVAGWEIVQFGLAELVASGRYRLTRLLRGQRGTEFAMQPVTAVGARVVVLDDALVPVPVSLAELDLPYRWRIGPASRPFTDSAYREIAFAAGGAGLRPFSPVHVRTEWLTGGDLSIRWIRRSRDLAADAWTGIEVPLAEESEAYEVEVMDGATVKRVLASSITSVSYTAAQQTADFGAALVSGDSLALRLYQLSARVGHGAPASVTLTI